MFFQTLVCLNTCSSLCCFRRVSPSSVELILFIDLLVEGALRHERIENEKDLVDPLVERSY